MVVGICFIILTRSLTLLRQLLGRCIEKLYTYCLACRWPQVLHVPSDPVTEDRIFGQET